MVNYHPGTRNGKSAVLSQKDEYFKPGEEIRSTIFKPLNFISGTTVSDLLASIHSQLPGDLFAIQTCQTLDHNQYQASAVFTFQDGILYHIYMHIYMYMKGLFGLESYSSAKKLPFVGHFGHSKT